MRTQAHPELTGRGRALPVWLPAGAAGLLCVAAAAVWDVVALLRVPAARAPALTHTLLAVGIGIGCAALLLRLLQRRRTEPRPAGAMAAIGALGILLGAWLLRGHPGIPPDRPLIVAQLCGLALGLHAARLTARDLRRRRVQ